MESELAQPVPPGCMCYVLSWISSWVELGMSRSELNGCGIPRLIPSWMVCKSVVWSQLHRINTMETRRVIERIIERGTTGYLLYIIAMKVWDVWGPSWRWKQLEREKWAQLQFTFSSRQRYRENCRRIYSSILHFSRYHVSCYHVSFFSRIWKNRIPLSYLKSRYELCTLPWKNPYKRWKNYFHEICPSSITSTIPSGILPMK